MDDEESAQAVRSALEGGYRLVDTASSYENERGVGRGLLDSGVDRAAVFLTTKLRGADHGYQGARRGLTASLDRLGVDYVDLLLIHWPLPSLGLFVETFRSMVEMTAEGLIRAVGVSNFTLAHIDTLIDRVGVVPAVNQLEISPLMARGAERASLARLGILAEAWSPLGSRHGLPDERVVRTVSATRERTPAQIILRWHVQQGIAAVPRSKDPQRQAANLSVFDFTLTDGEMDALGALDRGYADTVDADQHVEY
jgi:2,5-diketo-D-gluconate reductase A